MLEKCWENVGKMLEKCWKNVGKMLEKCWKNVGKMLEKCWKNVGKMLEKCWKNVEISIIQQVSFNLWPSSRMFWQRLEQLWALKREGLQMFDTHEPYWFWSRYFFTKRMGFPICNQQAIARQSTDFLQTYRMLMLINKLIAKWRPLDREIGV